ncbi:MAG: hypothetical protein GXO63_00370, partial [Candidatus Micrarchaeota archaeon]|nr:hypothetical protein [Candidatus Micrarchaeota archaeon]
MLRKIKEKFSASYPVLLLSGAAYGFLKGLNGLELDDYAYYLLASSGLSKADEPVEAVAAAGYQAVVMVFSQLIGKAVAAKLGY